MRVIIPCAGMATRWFGDTPKHLVPIFDEPILHRTVRLIQERTDADVRVVVKNLSDDRYKIPGATRATAKLDPSRSQADKLSSSRHLWSKTGRTVILWGDCFFTEVAMDRILSHDGDWCMFARLGPSKFTGKDHKEPFGFSLAPEHHDVLDLGINTCIDQARAGTLTAWSGSWQMYRAALGYGDVRWPDLPTTALDNVTVIDDWTDDFDVEDDWRNWCWHWAKENR